jgi:hypothetical protein
MARTTFDGPIRIRRGAAVTQATAALRVLLLTLLLVKLP